MRLPLLLFHLLTAVSAVKYDDLRPLIAVGITSSVLLAQHFGCSQRWINQLKREASPAGAPALAHLLLPRPGDAQLFQWVQDEVHRLGHAYGTKMMVGALMASHPGYHFGRPRVDEALALLFPAARAARCSVSQRRILRGHYHAPNFMHSCHLDLACKLQEYSVYVAAMIDGDSRMCLSLVALDNKLPVNLYQHVFVPFAQRWGGLPDQVVTDHGKEFVLIGFVCLLIQQLSASHRHSRRKAHKTVRSTSNIRVEKFNAEINLRVLVPVRFLLNHLESNNLLDKDDYRHIGAFSRLITPLMQTGLDRLAAAWNEHYVASKRGRPGTGGRPSVRMSQRPHPGPQMQLPAGFDGLGYWNMAGQPPLRMVPEQAPARDRLHGNLPAQIARATAVAALIGSYVSAWDEILVGNYHRFTGVYLAWLAH